MEKKLSAKQRILTTLCAAWPESVRLKDLMEYGGTCAYRRIKELEQNHGIAIEFYHEYRKGKKTNTTRYFLIPDPQNVDIENLCLRNI